MDLKDELATVRELRWGAHVALACGMRRRTLSWRVFSLVSAEMLMHALSHCSKAVDAVTALAIAVENDLEDMGENYAKLAQVGRRAPAPSRARTPLCSDWHARQVNRRWGAFLAPAAQD